MENLIRHKLERGKQVGKVFSFELDGEVIWSSVAIQKWENSYKVYIDEIFESDMDSEEYQKEIIRSFPVLDEAISFVSENSKIQFHDLAPLKGQRIFNPAFEE